MENQAKQSEKTKVQGRKKITAYIRELSVVVVGVAITLGVSAWLTRQNEKRDMEQYLDAIRIELHENLKDIQVVTEDYEDHHRLRILLRTHGVDKIPGDTLNAYAHIIGSIVSPTFSKSAFNMMNASGSMRQIKDKHLLQSIWSCYSILDYTQNYCDKYMDRKIDELFKMEREQADSVVGDAGRFAIRNFLAFLSVDSGIPSLLAVAAEKIEETLFLLRDDSR